jgi:hypothetical protein
MRSTIIVAAFMLFGLTNAVAQPALPPDVLKGLRQTEWGRAYLAGRTVDLDAPGALEALQQTNPAHGRSLEVASNDARLWHPWLHINRLPRVMHRRAGARTGGSSSVSRSGAGTRVGARS